MPSEHGDDTTGTCSIALAAVQEGWDDDEDAPLLVEALERLDGVRARPAMWDDDRVDWAAFDLVVIRSTWDYAQRPAAFLDWARRVQAVTRLENPAPVVAWNIDKRYLGELGERGVPIVPTSYLSPGAGTAEIEHAIGRDSEVVVKPTVSAGSRDTARHPADDPMAAAAHARDLLEAGRDVMVQPYLDAVDEQGETGMVFFEGTFSHAFRKGPLLHAGAAPVAGLFAPERIGPRQPEPGELALAERVLDASRERLGVEQLLYARVDVLRGPDGSPVLLELELVEPSFFLTVDPAAAERAARAIATRARAI